MSSPHDHSRNAEIWSTRLQKELLALTTDNATESETKQVAGILPPFLAVKSHELDIGAGLCKVSFMVNVTGPSEIITDETTPLVVVMDASLARKSDGSIDADAPAYPFSKPSAALESGANRLPLGSTLRDGDTVDIDCDWTPSLHLTDAVLNVGLKLKESLLQQEPIHPAVVATGAGTMADSVDDIVKSARRFGSFLGKSAKSLVESKPSASLRRSNKKETPSKKATSAADVNIGDEIHLLEAPWVDCQGLYSCKAIRRPSFVEDAIFLAQTKKQEEQVSSAEGDDGDVPEDFGNFVKLQAGTISKAAGAGFAGAGAMFRSFTQSAKSVLEESFLMITETHIIELKSSKLNLSTGTVTFAISIDLLAKLKFRREESISLFFKPAPDDPLIFMCPDSAAAVHQIQTVLKAHGVRGKHTNAATQKAIHEALQLVQEIQAKERALEYQPSVERVNEIMDLYRQAAERFEVAGDIRHEEVVMHMRKFLAMPQTASILDGSYQPEKPPEKETMTEDGTVPEGEVLERTEEQLEADDDASVGGHKADDDDFTKNIESVLNEAKTDLQKLNDGLDEDLDGIADDGGLDDLDAMLNAADKELEDLMSS